MKSTLLALGFALAAMPIMAQEHSDNYNQSVFRGIHKLYPSEPARQMQTLQKVQQYFPGMTAATDRLTGSFTDLFGTAISLPGNTPAEKAQHCLNNQLTHFGINAGEWQQVAQYSSGNAIFIRYEQKIAGKNVVFSRLSFRFTNDGRLQRIQLKTYGTPAPGATASLPVADAKQLIGEGLDGVVVSNREVNPNWNWFPVPGANGYELRPAYEFTVSGQGKNLPVELHGFVDAITGSILYRHNTVRDILDRTVKGQVYKQNPTLPATTEALTDLEININGNVFYTDTAGLINDLNLSVPSIATIKLQGKWAKVNSVITTNPFSSVTPSFQDTILTNGGFVLFPTLAPSSDRHVNAYYHVTRVHDFMKGYFPTFTGMDFSLPTNVDRTDGNCNAFYNGSSINFYAAANGCNSFAMCGDIIYHEYGHGINDKFYNAHGAGTMYNGALNEGEADVWGMSITEDPVLGKGINSGNGIIRRYDLAPKVYPQDIEGEVHADGEIIAGAWWDLAVNLNSTAMMTDLFTKTFFDTPDGADGTEGEVYHSVLISALMNDDDDANLTNGTPHFMEIVNAFARHGIYLLGDAVLRHTEIEHPAANTPAIVTANLNVSVPAFLSDVTLFYRDRGNSTAWDSIVMTPAGGSLYEAQIPGFAAGTIVDYYFAIFDSLNHRNATFPQGFVSTQSSSMHTIPYQYAVGVSKAYGFDFESPVTGWTVGSAPLDNATGGIWTIAQPIGSYINTVTGLVPVQTNDDHTLGVNGDGSCLVTGNASSTSAQIGVADVDGGKTTTITQMLDLTGFEEPIIEYYRWYSNDMGSNPGQDYWQVQAKDVNASTFVTSVDYTRKSDAQWRRKIFAVRKTPYISNSTQIMLRFIANDANPGSVVEAAVDDIYVYDLTSALSAGTTPSQDKASFYPNPANNEIMVRVPMSSEGYVALFDLTGKQLSRTDITGAGTYSISTAKIPAGTYFITIKTSKLVQSHKVSVIH